ncbi:TonB-dependent siderophore receptor [Bordetella genomosp. 12]|uniref:TonB-dependent siderophore receptor n=2 Tax=Bordetella genomosp. 12 TaxID=463035 RepID=A0A261VEP9_9BORD|nr:TonB-dependent siderophore receptor [Bordetella genomosp. 12]
MLCSALSSALILAASGPAHAQSAHSVVITGGPLAAVLANYAAAVGVQLIFDPAQLAGRSSGGLTGSVDTQEGFNRLLAGSGFQARPDGAGSYVLSRLSSVSELPAVTVTGRAAPGVTEGSGSYASNALTLGKGTQTLREIPQSVSVVTRQQMDDQNMNSLSDAMRNVTGITVETLSAGAGISGYISRGYAMDTVQVDGMSMPAGSGDLSTGLDLAVYDRIEVLRGPSGLYQGTGEPGGTINLVRKRPLQDFAFSAQTSVGSWDYYRAVADLSTPFDSEGKVRGRFVAGYDDRGSFMSRVKSEHPVFYGVVEADIAPRTTVAAGFAWQRNRSTPSFGLPAYADGSLLDVKRATNLSADWNRIEEETTEIFADLEHRLDGGGRIKASVFHRDIDNPVRNTTWSNSAVNPVTGDTNLIAWSYRNHWKTTGGDVNLNLPVDLFGREHSLLIGADYRHTIKDFSYGGGTVYPSNIYNPVTSFPQPEMDRVNGSLGRVTQFGLYTRANVQLADAWKLIAGARLSWWKNDARNNNFYFDDFSQNIDRIDARTSPYAGLIYDFTPQWSAYVSYTSIFQPQTDTTAQGSTLKPRTGRQIETGVKGELLDGRLNTHAALFQIVDRNRAMTDPDNPYFSVAAGKVRSQGFETEVSGSPFPGWDVIAGYAYTDTKYLEAPDSTKGQTFSAITPRHAISLWTRYHFRQPALQGFSVGAGVRFNSGFYEESDDVRWKQGSFTTVSAQIGYRYDKHLEATLTVDNLFDRVYYEKLGGESRQNYYGQPRSVMLTMRYQY